MTELRPGIRVVHTGNGPLGDHAKGQKQETVPILQAKTVGMGEGSRKPIAKRFAAQVVSRAQPSVNTSDWFAVDPTADEEPGQEPPPRVQADGLNEALQRELDDAASRRIAFRHSSDGFRCSMNPLVGRSLDSAMLDSAACNQDSVLIWMTIQGSKLFQRKADVGPYWLAVASALHTGLTLKTDFKQLKIQGNTLLHFAAYCNDAAMLQQLLDAGLDVNASNGQSQTPLTLALCRPDSHAVVRLLLMHLRPQDLRGVFDLICKSDVKYLRYMLECYREVAHKRDPHGNTLMHYAAMCEAAAHMDMLIQHGADCNAQDHQGLTPLHLAAIDQRKPIVQCLIHAPVDVAITDRTGRTPGLYAMLKNQLQDEPTASDKVRVIRHPPLRTSRPPRIQLTSPRMRSLVDVLKPGEVQVRVDLGCGDAFVP